MAMSKTISFRIGDDEYAVLEKAATEMNMTVGDYARTVATISTKMHLEKMKKAVSDYEHITAITERARSVVDEQLRIYDDLKKQSTQIAGASIPLIQEANRAATEASKHFGV